MRVFGAFVGCAVVGVAEVEGRLWVDWESAGCAVDSASVDAFAPLLAYRLVLGVVSALGAVAS